MFDRPIGWLISFSLFRRARAPLSGWNIIAWWEWRRIPYNLFVGTAGFASGCLILISAVATESITGEAVGLPDPPIFAILGVVAYAVLANVCYTGGWVVELLSRRILGDRAEAFGEIAFTLGTIASILLTLVPGLLIVLVGICVLIFR